MARVSFPIYGVAAPAVEVRLEGGGSWGGRGSRSLSSLRLQHYMANGAVVDVECSEPDEHLQQWRRQLSLDAVIRNVAQWGEGALPMTVEVVERSVVIMVNGTARPFWGVKANNRWAGYSEDPAVAITIDGELEPEQLVLEPIGDHTLYRPDVAALRAWRDQRGDE